MAEMEMPFSVTGAEFWTCQKKWEVKRCIVGALKKDIFFGIKDQPLGSFWMTFFQPGDQVVLTAPR